MPVTFRRQDNLKATEAEERIGKAITSEFTLLGDALVADLQGQAPVDRGGFKKSIRRRVSGRGFKTRLLVYSTSDHAEYIEKGRTPGKAPPPPVLLAWVRRKGLGANAFSIRTKRALTVGIKRTVSRATGKKRTARQSLLEVQKGIAYRIGQDIKKFGLPRITGHKPSHGLHLFEKLQKRKATEIRARISRARVAVTKILNEGNAA